jgi:sugar (pentulose or hexulose) kinase
MNVTVSTELMRDLLGLDIAALNERVEAAPIGASGLLLLPYFNGERTPPLPAARATIYGLNSTNMTAENLCRASMEGATLGLRYALDSLKRNGIVPSEIRLVGGGARSRAWRGMAAAVFGCPVVGTSTEEAGAFGAALQAIWCYDSREGSRRSLKEITDEYVRLDESTRVEPDPASVERYAELYAAHLKLNETMKAMY